MVPGGGLVLATDTGVFYRAPRCKTWSILGHGLPTTTAMQVRLGPDGRVYLATHGRGQWALRP